MQPLKTATATFTGHEQQRSASSASAAHRSHWRSVVSCAHQRPAMGAAHLAALARRWHAICCYVWAIISSPGGASWRAELAVEVIAPAGQGNLLLFPRRPGQRTTIGLAGAMGLDLASHAFQRGP